MIRIITDFDGPIMDVSERYYRVYRFCLDTVQHPGQPLTILSKPQFWQLKRSQVPERQIGLMSGLDESQAEQFAQLRRQTVHTLPYLKYDTPVAGAIATLERLQNQSQIDLVVMTLRRVRELQDAFDRYDLARFFASDRRYCLSNDYVKTTDVQDKPLLMQQALAELIPVSQTWMIGDTEADIIAAKTHGIQIIAVLCGIRDRTQLLQYQPDWIVNNLSEATDLALQLSHGAVLG
ncbi:HAD family hydrolase [Oscillatoria sp. FACHB-1407]|uniref:HAD family hydrolase n=1 Tax=Oscillatoria sp. FACHB-1407 TaxID=2692847 RepID=UPI001685BD21|nr:HAD family hydrolase [Oscillatoria sp. FACHB-1407]MBD2460841.1 HAD family hydrolase [Oscillatoria sp. FACHB-1407]